jgi:hypothetical protein
MSVEENSPGIIHDLEQSRDVFEQKLSEQSRHMAWVSVKAKWYCVSYFKNMTLLSGKRERFVYLFGVLCFYFIFYFVLFSFI